MAEAPTRTAPDRVTTPLLTLITQQSLDEDYQHVAERRRAPGAAPGGRRRAGTAAAVLLVFGLLVAVAAVQTSRGAGAASASRSSLIANIDQRRADVSGLQRTIVDLREHNVALQEDLDGVTARAQAATSRVRALGLVTGFTPVTGPGVRITVDDSPSGVPVLDRHLRPLVDGLWNAGAEAIAVNGHRLTARSAIRNSGEAIRVTGNERTLSPPYVVTAIGDPRTLQADLMDTTSGLTFRAAAESNGFPWSMDNVGELSLPAAPDRMLHTRWAVAGTAEQQKAADQQHDQHQDRKETPQ